MQKTLPKMERLFIRQRWGGPLRLKTEDKWDGVGYNGLTISNFIF